MVVTDPIADMLTRIRNANQLKYKEVLVPTSKLKVEIANILKNEGYINGYKFVSTENGSMMNIELKYGAKKERVITGLKRISKPGLRVYAKKEEIPKPFNTVGISSFLAYIW